MSFNIIGTGTCVPEKTVTNDDLSKFLDTSDEWIRQRVGVVSRHICTTETVSDLAQGAAERALENCGLSADDLDLIIGASVSGDYMTPSVACMVQGRIGAKCPAFDISAACSSFVFMLETAAGFFARGKVENVLVVGAERLSGVLDWTDRSTCPIFGDGAGAAVLTKGSGYIDSTMTTHGGDDVIRIPRYAGASPYYMVEPAEPYTFMAGQETFKYAVNSISSDVEKLLADNSLSADDIAYIVPHQANKRIIDFASHRLKMSKEKFYLNIENYGNTSSASIPIALDEMNRSGMLKRGDKLIFTAFGGGLANASCLVEW